MLNNAHVICLLKHHLRLLELRYDSWNDAHVMHKLALIEQIKVNQNVKN